MTHHLVRFAQGLRSAGLSVSPADLLAAAQAIQAAGISDRDTFRLALRSCLVKAPEHLTPFDRLFEAYFRAAWPVGDQHSRRHAAGGRPTDRPTREPRQPGHGQRPAPEPKPQPPRRPEPQPTTPPGRPTPGCPAQPPSEPTQAAVPSARPPSVPSGDEPQREQEVARVRADLARQQQASPARRPLWQRTSPTEEADLAREAERLGRALRTRLGRRRRRAATGRVDVRATVALAARSGGVPWTQVKKVRRLARPRLLVLCDVSGSVIRPARMLLRLLWETRRLFDQTSGFVFVDRPVPAEPLFRGADFAESLAQLEHLPGLDLHAYSDFGHLFVKLLSDHGELLTRRTAVLVLGDARCNRFDPQVWALAEIAQRCARVVWLNPERRERWYTADSRLRDYEPWAEVVPAATLAELAAGVERLVSQPGLHRI